MNMACSWLQCKGGSCWRTHVALQARSPGSWLVAGGRRSGRTLWPKDNSISFVVLHIPFSHLAHKQRECPGQLGDEHQSWRYLLHCNVSHTHTHTHPTEKQHQAPRKTPSWRVGKPGSPGSPGSPGTFTTPWTATLAVCQICWRNISNCGC